MRIEMNDVEEIFPVSGQVAVLFTDGSVLYSDGLFYYHSEDIPSADFSGEGKHHEYDVDYGDEDILSDVEADAMTLRDVGWGTEEDYGYYGEDEY